MWLFISYARLHKVIKDITKYLQSHDSGPWPQNKVSALDRALGEIGRILEKKVRNVDKLGNLTHFSVTQFRSQTHSDTKCCQDTAHFERCFVSNSSKKKKGNIQKM